MKTKLTIIVLLITTFNLVAQETAQKAGWELLTSEFDSLPKRGLVGGALCRADKGKIIDYKMYGYQDQANKIPITKKTIYNWGSNTKVITAVCIMQLKEQGRLRLDDPVIKYVPEFRWMRTDSVGVPIDSVKIKHLLTHTAYFIFGNKFNFYHGSADKDYNPIRWEQIAAVLPYYWLVDRPGLKFKYNSDGFIFLGRIIENIMRESYASYVHKNIFMPLGMTTAHFGVSPPHLRKYKSVSYRKRKGDSVNTVYRLDHHNYGYGNPVGGLFASVPDMMKFVSFLAGGDKGKKELYNMVLPDTALDEMFEAKFVTRKQKKGYGREVGISIFRLSHYKESCAYHNGVQYGFLSYLMIQRSTGKAFVYALNTNNKRIFNYSYYSVINRGGYRFLLGYKPSDK